jgi:primosomal protein N' (replication factor Y)
MKTIYKFYYGLKISKYKTICIYNPIDDFLDEYAEIKKNVTVDWALNKDVLYNFILVFVTNQKDFNHFVEQTLSGLSELGIYCVVYPINVQHLKSDLNERNLTDLMANSEMVPTESVFLYKGWGIATFENKFAKINRKKSDKFKVLEVALPIPKFQTFSYTAKTKESLLGRRVIVSFGSRTLTGVVVDEHQRNNDRELKVIEDVIEEKTAFSPKMLKFIKWISHYYIAPEGEIYKAAIPPNNAPKSIKMVELIHLPPEDELQIMEIIAHRQFEILAILSKSSQMLSYPYIKKITNKQATLRQLEALESKGLIKIHDRITEVQQAKTKAFLFVSDRLQDEAQITAEYDTLLRKAPKQAELFSLIYERDRISKVPMAKSELGLLHKLSGTTVDALLKKNLIEMRNVEVSRIENNSEINSLAVKDESEMILNEEQKFAKDKICEAMNEMKYKTFLLHGVTGSGKTLVYMNIIKKAILDNKSTILMVPEISLTPQLIDRFENVFPNQVALMHSRLSDGERFEHWQSVLDGTKKIVIGARSAVFAPFPNLGLIIVDEEHDASYKQISPNPRYNGRDAAIMRSSIEDAVCVLGSATPSIETMYNAKTAKYELLQLTQRADNAKLPEIITIDMLNARKNGLVSGSFSHELIDNIVHKLELKEGIILLQNRRGYSPVLECPECGHVPGCENCSVTLTYHKGINELHCHYCGHKHKTNLICPKCGAFMAELGTGTQRVEEELEQILINKGIKAVIKRIDLDTTAMKGSLRKSLSDFAIGKTDILIGTQMLAKGLDFNRCTLVGVINADLQLFFSDFRSSERTFQLLMQVSGRAGRSKEATGKVIIQTTNPEHPALKAASNSDYNQFYDYEILERRSAYFPPFARFSIIEFSGNDNKLVSRASNEFVKKIPRSEQLMIYPPVSPFVNKINNEFRKYVVIKSSREKDPSGSILRTAIRTALIATDTNSSKIDTKIDIDSFSTL